MRPEGQVGHEDGEVLREQSNTRPVVARMDAEARQVQERPVGALVDLDRNLNAVEREMLVACHVAMLSAAMPAGKRNPPSDDRDRSASRVRGGHGRGLPRNFERRENCDFDEGLAGR